jgi:chromosome partitioning protein
LNNVIIDIIKKKRYNGNISKTNHLKEEKKQEMELYTEIVSIASRKGGTGKTTTALNLAYSLLEVSSAERILLIDMDSQANLTSSVDIINDVTYNVYDVIINDVNIAKVIYETNIKGIDIVPASVELADIEVEIADMSNRERLLEKAIKREKLDYDYIIIDTSPALNLATVNALTASSSVIITARPSLFSFQSIEEVIELIELINEELHYDILVTQIDRRTNISKEFLADLEENYQNHVFKTSISQNIALVEAVMDRLPVGLYDDRATTKKQYLELAKEKFQKDLERMD